MKVMIRQNEMSKLSAGLLNSRDRLARGFALRSHLEWSPFRLSEFLLAHIDPMLFKSLAIICHVRLDRKNRNELPKVLYLTYKKPYSD
jgi:hypothetical protein